MTIMKFRSEMQTMILDNSKLATHSKILAEHNKF